MPSAGAAIIDITPPPGLRMSGYVARSSAAQGAHDPLTVRAVVYQNQAIVVADVIGLHEDMSARIRRQAPLPAENIIVSALHNHGAPASMRGRLAEPCDRRFLDTLERACVDAIALALERARPCRLSAAWACEPGIAVNRRHTGGAVDDTLPIFELTDGQGDTIAVIVSYACHPVVLAADNNLYTADYPHYLRRALERRFPGAVALFITGAAADANNGHLASDSISLEADDKRSFAEARRIGEHIAHCAASAAMAEAGLHAAAASTRITLDSCRRESLPAAQLAARWRAELRQTTGARARLLQCWIHWAETIAPEPPAPLQVRVTLLNWGGCLFCALPGEIFASSAQAIRSLLESRVATAAMPSCIVGYAESNPGYIAPAEEFAAGGYEIDEAHRYYGRSASFAADSVDRLLQAVAQCADALITLAALDKQWPA